MSVRELDSVPDGYLEIGEAAAQTGLHRATVWRMVKAGTMDGVQVGGRYYLRPRAATDPLTAPPRGWVALGPLPAGARTYLQGLGFEARPCRNPGTNQMALYISPEAHRAWLDHLETAPEDWVQAVKLHPTGNVAHVLAWLEHHHLGGEDHLTRRRGPSGRVVPYVSPKAANAYLTAYQLMARKKSSSKPKSVQH